MFGYIKPNINELRVKEHEFYKSTYCGLCREMKKISLSLPFTLSYDFVFLALLRLAVSGESVSFKTCRCAANPFKKRVYTVSEKALPYSAVSSLVLTAYKIYDDKNDSKGIKRLYYSHLFSKMKRILKKANANALEAIVSKKIEELSLTEKACSESVYDAASIFGELLSEVFSHGLPEDEAETLKNIGYSVGRWIYIIDAIADVKSDLKHGNYNPFIESAENTSSESFRKNMEEALKIELAVSEKYIKRLEKKADPGILSIIYNILYISMPEIAHRVIYKIDTKKGGEEKNDD